MPARNSSMEMSSPEHEASSGLGRRKSGRVTKAPDFFGVAESAAATKPGKRKRDARADAEAEVADDDENASDDAEDDSDGDPDEEEMRERRRRRRSGGATKKAKASKKPAAKKPKVNGDAISLAIRPAAEKKKRGTRKAKPVQDAVAAGEAGGLYGEIFGSEKTIDEVVTEWIARFSVNESNSVAEIVNFVLKCAGCDLKIDQHDIEDPDACTSKLSDIQDEYQAQNVAEYPLISRNKGTAAFKGSLVGFFDVLIDKITTSGLFFDQSELIENVNVWLTALSSSSNRPLRHTSTVASLAIISALCEAGKKLVEQNAKTYRQSEGEKKKSRVNKGRVKAMQEQTQQASKRQGELDATIKDHIDTVFLHRYRDVDPRIRVDCVQALTDWIVSYPDLLFDGAHLRYLGWLLSDTNSSTRLEVVKQLQRLFKDENKLGGLKAFTERFRSRMIEMATLDSEPGVRAATVELIDILREAGFLEPDDVDAIGKLIFDSEPRVRKAVVNFFAENVNDVYEAKLEEVGGQEAIDEALPDLDEDDIDTPRSQWLKFKCLAEILSAYDAESDEVAEQAVAGTGYLSVGPGIETRFSLAAQAIYGRMEEIRDWEVMAGLLLCDLSGAADVVEDDDVEAKLKAECRLEEREEAVLLDVLGAAVKVQLSEASEGGAKNVRRTKAQRDELAESQEKSARQLAALIPRLLKKFGSNPLATSAVLRLEPLLNLEIFNELRQESTTFSDFLDDVQKQFLTHTSEAVAIEASAALLHARRNEELSDAAERTLRNLWDDTRKRLGDLSRNRDLSTRYNLKNNDLAKLSNIVLRITSLSSVSNSTEALDAPLPMPKKGKAQSPPSGIDVLITIIDRGLPSSTPDVDLDSEEDTLVRHACDASLFYFMWHINTWRSLILSGSALPDADVKTLSMRRDSLISNLEGVMRSRSGADSVRLAAAGLFLDLQNLFVALRNAKPRPGVRANPSESHVTFAAFDIAAGTRDLLVAILFAVERAFAKKSHRTLEVAEDDEPLDPDDEPESEDEEDDDVVDEARAEARLRATLAAEKALCDYASKLVLAVAGAVLDADEGDGAGKGAVRRALERNKGRLGKSFAEVVGYFDKGRERAKAKPKPKSAAAAGAAQAKSAAVVVEDEEDEEDEQMDDQQANEEAVADEERIEREDEEHREREDEEDGGGGGGDHESVVGD